MDTRTNVPDMCRKEKKSKVRDKGGGGGGRLVNSVRVGILVVGDTDAPGGDRGTADHLHPPAAKEKLAVQFSSLSVYLQVLHYNQCISVFSSFSLKVVSLSCVHEWEKELARGD